MKVLVTGATGALGHEVVVAARAAGISVRGASRRPKSARENGMDWVEADLASGQGLDDAVRNVDAIVHAATDPRRADEVDVRGTERLLDAAHAAGIRHLVYISIVGIDDIPVRYYKQKRAAETTVSRGGVPFSILRATQFHSYVDRVISAAARVPLVIPIPAGFLIQSVEASEVAGRLIQCLVDGPRERVPDFGGPDILLLKEAAELWRDVRQLRKRVVAVPVLGRTAAAFRAGKSTAPQGERGAISWREWLMHTRQ
jgi:uncharacterized protein YbjT (DUF2867 family)